MADLVLDPVVIGSLTLTKAVETVSSGAASSVGGGSIVVAGKNAPDYLLDGPRKADYILTGTRDDVILNVALSRAKGTAVELVGQAELWAPLYVIWDNFNLHGLGAGRNGGTGAETYEDGDGQQQGSRLKWNAAATGRRMIDARPIGVHNTTGEPWYQTVLADVAAGQSSIRVGSTAGLPSTGWVMYNGVYLYYDQVTSDTIGGLRTNPSQTPGTGVPSGILGTIVYKAGNVNTRTATSGVANQSTLPLKSVAGLPVNGKGRLYDTTTLGSEPLYWTGIDYATNTLTGVTTSGVGRIKNNFGADQLFSFGPHDASHTGQNVTGRGLDGGTIADLTLDGNAWVGAGMDAAISWDVATGTIDNIRGGRVKLDYSTGSDGPNPGFIVVTGISGGAVFNNKFCKISIGSAYGTAHCIVFQADAADNKITDAQLRSDAGAKGAGGSAIYTESAPGLQMDSVHFETCGGPQLKSKSVRSYEASGCRWANTNGGWIDFLLSSKYPGSFSCHGCVWRTPAKAGTTVDGIVIDAVESVRCGIDINGEFSSGSDDTRPRRLVWIKSANVIGVKFCAKLCYYDTATTDVWTESMVYDQGTDTIIEHPRCGVSVGYVVGTAGMTITPVATNGDHINITVNASSFTLALPTQLSAGWTFYVTIKNNSGGAITVTFGSGWTVVGWTDPANTKSKTFVVRCMTPNALGIGGTLVQMGAPSADF